MERSEFTGEFSIVLMLDGGNIILNESSIIDFHFTEDIFAYFMVGRITFIDEYGIAEYGPLTGNEKIVLSYGRDQEKQLVFHMVKVDKIAQSSVANPTRENGIVIDFADSSFENFVGRRLSRSWKKGRITDIVKHILENWIGDPEISKWEDNVKEVNVCFPYFTPMECMKWLSKRGRGEISGMPGFVYYNNTDEGFRGNWVSLDYLFGDNVYIDPDPYLFEAENPYYKNIIQYWSISGIDRIIMKGIKGGHRFGYDFEKKELLDQEYGYEDDIKKVMMLGGISLYDDVTDYRTLYKHVGEESTEDIDNIYHAGFIERYSLQQALTIVVRGFEHRFAGMQLNIEWASSDTSQRWNKMWKGKWLVKSITHIFNQRHNMAYRQKMVLLKNAYYDADQRKLLKATRINKK